MAAPKGAQMEQNQEGESGSVMIRLGIGKDFVLKRFYVSCFGIAA